MSLATTTSIPAIDFDIYDHALQDAPYPTYARLRAEAPLFHQREHDYWVLSRHADVLAATRDDDTYSNRMGVSIDPSAWNENAHVVMSFLAMDPPEQARLRRLVSKGFTPRRTRDLAPRVQQLTDHYLDAALARGEELDWIADVAGRLPMDVISEMMGVPEADRDEVRRLADLVVHRENGLRDVPPAGMEAALVLFDYYRAFVEDKKAHPGDDLTTALLHAEDEGKRMTDAEINAFLFLMVVAGNETTTKLLGNAVVHLAAHPEQRAQVLADASLVPAWIEETLRFDTSSQFIGRLLLRDLTVGDVTAPAGAKLLLALGAANHDEAVFTDPARFDLHRDPEELAQILSFGGGRHFCIGAHLARMEARIALDALVSRVSDFTVDRERCVRFYSANVRGFAHVPMTVVPR